MEIKEHLIVPLGYGKFVRSDKIIALEPIKDGRGPGNRTKVFVEQLPGPIIASRTENTIVDNIAKTPIEVLEATAALALLQDILDDISKVGPMLRKSINKEAGLDLEELERRIKEIFK